MYDSLSGHYTPRVPGHLKIGNNNSCLTLNGRTAPRTAATEVRGERRYGNGNTTTTTTTSCLTNRSHIEGRHHTSQSCVTKDVQKSYLKFFEMQLTFESNF